MSLRVPLLGGSDLSALVLVILMLRDAVTDEPPIPQMVGNAFVEQYYSILHQTPHLVYRFYHESSVLSRPEEDGSMTMVTTIEGINNKIISLDYTRCRVEILSADAQPSYKDGVMVVVTGCLIGSDNLKRKFIQSFFLAPQDKVYFVLNDVFRYVDEYKLVDFDPVPTNDADESATTAAFIPEPDPNHVPEISPTSQTSVVGTDTKVSEKVRQPLENGKLSVTEKMSAAEKAVAAEKVIAANHLNESRPQEHHTRTEKAASNTQEDAPKKTFASIVNALKDNTVPFNVRAPTVKPVEPPRASIRPASETPAPSSDTALEKKEDIAVRLMQYSLRIFL